MSIVPNSKLRGADTALVDDHQVVAHRFGLVFQLFSRTVAAVIEPLDILQLRTVEGSNLQSTRQQGFTLIQESTWCRDDDSFFRFRLASRVKEEEELRGVSVWWYLWGLGPHRAQVTAANIVPGHHAQYTLFHCPPLLPRPRTLLNILLNTPSFSFSSHHS